MSNNSHVNLVIESGVLERRLKATIEALYDLFPYHVARLSDEREETWEKFRSHNSDEQSQILKKAECYLEICMTTRTSGDRVTDTGRLLWYAIRKLNNRPTSDLFDKIGETDVVEIYNAQGVQVFRNHRFFEICSYGFSELFIYSWHELYERETHVDEILMGYGADILSGKYTKSVPVEQIPYHKMEEKFSPELYTMKMQEKLFSPLRNNNGDVEHIVAISNVEVISQKHQNTKRPQTIRPMDLI